MQIQGHIDDEHRLSAVVPDSVPPGPVTVWIALNANRDEADYAWMCGIGGQWIDDLADRRQDIYSLSDGEPIGPG